MLEWALPRWPGRIDPATIHASRKSVVLRPQKPKSLIPLSLWFDEKDHTLRAQRSDRDKAQFELMLGLGFSLDERTNRFERRLTARDGAPSDRLAEVAAQVYAAGWPVEVPSKELADKVVQGRYLRGQERWLDVLPDGNFLFRWEYKGDEVYKALGNVHTARWSKELGGSVASRHAFEQIEDFALSWGFAITDEAQVALIQARKDAARELIGVEIVIPEKIKLRPTPAPRLEEVSIPDDLLADDD